MKLLLLLLLLINISINSIPVFWDWRKYGIVNPIKNQYGCNACWAFSAVGTLEIYLMKYIPTPIILSEQNMIDCVTNISIPPTNPKYKTCCQGCKFGEVSTVYDYLMNNQNGKVPWEYQYPYIGRKSICRNIPSKVSISLKNYVYLPENDEDTMKQVIYTTGPLSVTLHISNDWYEYKGGIYNNSHDCKNPNSQKHSVIIVGYGEKYGVEYWVVRNSWGKEWGLGGYMEIIRGKNICGIANIPIYPLLDL